MLRVRVASAAVLIPLLAAVLVLGGHWLTALIGVIAAVAGWEAADLLRRAGLWASRSVVAALAAATALTAAMAPDDPRAWALLVAAVVLVPGLVALRHREPREGFLAWSGSVFGVVYVGLIGALLRIVHDAPPIPEDAALSRVLDAGRAWLVILVLGVWAYDTFAYAAGRAFHRGSFMAHISPSKTWSGVIGGLAGCLVVSAALVMAAGQGPLPGLAVGLVIGVTAQAGDLAESLLKRAAGAKDSGRLIPGHGGVLDRIDSFLFAAPALHLLLVLLPWSRPGA